jgi:hypothetical protein
MRKLRFAYFLTAAQFVIFLTLIHWDTVDIPYLGSIGGLCFAINSPGLVVYQIFALMAPVRWLPPAILGIRSDHFIFLVGVVVQWYFIGRELDRLRPPKSAATLTTATLLANIFVIAWGVRLIFGGMDGILQVDSSHQHFAPYIIDGIITLAWALILIVVPTVRLVKCFYRRQPIRSSV